MVTKTKQQIIKDMQRLFGITSIVSAVILILTLILMCTNSLVCISFLFETIFFASVMIFVLSLSALILTIKPL